MLFIEKFNEERNQCNDRKFFFLNAVIRNIKIKNIIEIVEISKSIEVNKL